VVCRRAKPKPGKNLPPLLPPLVDLHFVDTTSKQAEELTVQYLMVVDALNFCFWPDPELEYQQLSLGVKVCEGRGQLEP